MDNTQDNGTEQEWGVPDGPPPRLDLPFGRKRKSEIGEWIYDNRETICISAIVYLTIVIILLSSKIVLLPRDVDPPVIVEFREPEKLQELEEELRKAQEINDMLNAGQNYSSVKNRISNENVEELRERLSEETREIYERSEQIMEELDRNGSEYEQMLAAVPQERVTEDRKREAGDARVEGGVTVSFSLAKPLRHAVSLPVPSYKCPGGGTVVVDVVVSRNGDVLSAGVDKSRSSSDNCMNAAALEMARRSRFNVDPKAPGRHTGIITYVFVPQ